MLKSAAEQSTPLAHGYSPPNALQVSEKQMATAKPTKLRSDKLNRPGIHRTNQHQAARPTTKSSNWNPSTIGRLLRRYRRNQRKWTIEPSIPLLDSLLQGLHRASQCGFGSSLRYRPSRRYRRSPFTGRYPLPLLRFRFMDHAKSRSARLGTVV